MIRVVKIEKFVYVGTAVHLVEMGNVRIDQPFRLQKSSARDGVYYTGPLPTGWGRFPGLIITTERRP